MGGFGFVQPQCVGNGLQYLVRNPGEVPALQPGIVVHTDGGQGGDSLPAQAGHAPVGAHDQVHLLRRHLGPAGPEEFTYVALTIHAFRLRPGDASAGGPAQYTLRRGGC